MIISLLVFFTITIIILILFIIKTADSLSIDFAVNTRDIYTSIMDYSLHLKLIRYSIKTLTCLQGINSMISSYIPIGYNTIKDAWPIAIVSLIISFIFIFIYQFSILIIDKIPYSNLIYRQSYTIQMISEPWKGIVSMNYHILPSKVLLSQALVLTKHANLISVCFYLGLSLVMVFGFALQLDSVINTLLQSKMLYKTKKVYITIVVTGLINTMSLIAYVNGGYGDIYWFNGFPYTIILVTTLLSKCILAGWVYQSRNQAAKIGSKLSLIVHALGWLIAPIMTTIMWNYYKPSHSILELYILTTLIFFFTTATFTTVAIYLSTKNPNINFFTIIKTIVLGNVHQLYEKLNNLAYGKERKRYSSLSKAILINKILNNIFESIKVTKLNIFWCISIKYLIPSICISLITSTVITMLNNAIFSSIPFIISAQLPFVVSSTWLVLGFIIVILIFVLLSLFLLSSILPKIIKIELVDNFIPPKENMWSIESLREYKYYKASNITRSLVSLFANILPSKLLYSKNLRKFM